MKIAGLDIGTTGCKCTVFDEQGKYLGKAYRDYPVRRAHTRPCPISSPAREPFPRQGSSQDSNVATTRNYSRR